MSKYLKIFFLILFIPVFGSSQKMMSFSNVYVPEGGFTSIFGDHIFADNALLKNPGKIMTARQGNKGYFNFITGSSWQSASSYQFVDGYVKVFHNDGFVFPTGNDQEYRPVAISGAKGMAAAYFADNVLDLPEMNAYSDERVKNILDLGYWDLISDESTHITLSWDVEDNMGALTNNTLENIAIVGRKNGKWHLIEAEVDFYSTDFSTSENSESIDLSDLSKGSITTKNEIVANDYEFFTLASLQENADLVGTNNNSSLKIDFHLFPNPSFVNEEISIDYNIEAVEGGILEIFNLYGQLIKRYELSNSKGLIKLKAFESIGTHVVRVTDYRGNSKFKKMIIVR